MVTITSGHASVPISFLFYSILGCVLPLQEVAIRRSPPSFTVFCYPCPISPQHLSPELSVTCKIPMLCCYPILSHNKYILCYQNLLHTRMTHKPCTNLECRSQITMDFSTSWVDLDCTRIALYGSLQILHFREDVAHAVVGKRIVWRNAEIQLCPYHLNRDSTSATMTVLLDDAKGRLKRSLD